MVNINERCLTVVLEHRMDTLATERRGVLAKYRARIPPIIANHCSWPDTSTYLPSKLKVSRNVENKTASIDARKGVGIVDNVEAHCTKKTLFKRRIGRILYDTK
jgi:hypothetical protein